MKVKDIITAVNQLKQQTPVFDFSEFDIALGKDKKAFVSLGVDMQNATLIIDVEQPKVETKAIELDKEVEEIE